jgi:hypothetical protein
VVKDVWVGHPCPLRDGRDPQPRWADLADDLFRRIQDRRSRFFDGSTRSHCHAC